MTTSKITNKRILAIELSKRTVSMEEISLGLKRIVELWVKRNEVKVVNNQLVLS